MAIAVLPPPRASRQGVAEISVLWVSTDLRILRPEPSWRLAPDFAIDARCYRKLDPEYFAWLRSRMLEVKAAHKAGRVPQAAFDELRTRFNELQENAIALFGQQALQDALRGLRAPSTAHLLPARSRAVLARKRRHSPSRQPGRMVRGLELLPKPPKPRLMQFVTRRWNSAGPARRSTAVRRLPNHASGAIS